LDYRGKFKAMALKRSKVTADGENIVARRAGSFSSEDIHRALFPNGPPKRRTADEMKEGIERYVRERYARR
jgi:hypothetical protein